MKNGLSKGLLWFNAFDLRLGIIKIHGALVWLFFLGITSWSLCFELDRVDMNVWDESLFALRAYHLFDQGAFLQNFNQYPGLYDHPSTKLPLVTIFQALVFQLGGPSVFTLRITVSILLLILLVYWCYWCYRNTPYPYLGFLTILILLSSPRFLGEHMARTGDHDAILAIFLTLASLSFYRYTINWEPRFLWPTTGWFLAALLTKNLLAGMVLPAWLIFLLINRKLLKLCQQKYVYMMSVFIILVYGLVLGLYEWQYPGFVLRMWDYELMGRYTKVIEGHTGGFFYYWELLWREDFNVYFWIWCWFSLYGFFKGAKFWESLASFSFIIIIVCMLVLSASSTKLPWYHAVVFPFMSLQIAYQLLGFISSWKFENARLVKPIISVFITAAIVIGMIGNSLQVHSKNLILGTSGYLESFKSLATSNILLSNNVLLEDDFGSDTYFYTKSFMYQTDGQEDFRMERNVDSLKTGEAVLLWKPWLMQRMESRYKIEKRAQFDQMHYWIILGRRD